VTAGETHQAIEATFRIERARLIAGLARMVRSVDLAEELAQDALVVAARLILRDLVNASVGFEALAIETNKPSKSLHRMLSEHGNPSMDNLAAIFGAVRRRLGVEIEARAVEAA
jgi:DNA-binding phage protein